MLKFYKNPPNSLAEFDLYSLWIYFQFDDTMNDNGISAVIEIRKIVVTKANIIHLLNNAC